MSLAVLGCLLPAAAADTRTLRAPDAVSRSCESGPLASGTPGVARTGWMAPASGLLTAKLEGGLKPDWDLVAFRVGEADAVAASTSFASAEQIGIWVEADDRIIIQACRRGGPRAEIPVELDLFRPPPAGRRRARASLESVPVSGAADVARLERLGLDVTDDVSSGAATVALYSDAQRDLLGSVGFDSRTLVPDLAARDRSARRAEQRRAAPGLGGRHLGPAHGP